MPALLLVGSETSPYYKKAAATVATVLSDVRTVKLPGQEHGAHTAAPDLLAGKILRFLPG